LKMDSGVVDEYVQKVFSHIWQDNGSIDTIEDIEQILLKTKMIDSLDKGVKLQDAWKKYCQNKGLEHLDITQTEAKTMGINTTPTFLIGSEPFKGRAHLPLILARFKARI